MTATPMTPRDRRRFASVLLVLMWGSWAVSYLMTGGHLNILGQPFAGDHLAFYTAARRVLEGNGAHIYEYESTEKYQESLFPEGEWKGLLAYRNPPFYALLYAPTARWSVAQSATLWSAVSFAALGLGLRWLRPPDYGIALFWSLLFLPVFCTISYGQNSLLSFAVFAGCYRLLANGRPFLAGLTAGLLWYKPTLVIGLLIWWGTRPWHHRRELAGLVAGGAILTLGSYPVIPDAWHAFAASLGANVRFDDFEPWKAHNPRAFARLLLPGQDFATARQAITLVATVLGVAWFLRLRRRLGERLPELFGAAALLTLWASPHTMIYEWSLALIPAVLWYAARPELRPALAPVYIVVWGAFLTATDVGHGVDIVQRKQWGWPEMVWVQYTVPVVAWGAWRAGRLLAGEEEPNPPAPFPQGKGEPGVSGRGS